MQDQWFSGVSEMRIQASQTSYHTQLLLVDLLCLVLCLEKYRLYDFVHYL